MSSIAKSFTHTATKHGCLIFTYINLGQKKTLCFPAEIGDYDDVTDRDYLRTNKLLPYQEKVQEKIMELHRRHL